jgi:TRAP-type uncharacterized transport system fused permease subunit
MFVYAPELLCKGSFSAIFLATASAVLGITALAAAVQRCFLIKCNKLEIFLLLAVAAMMIKPGVYTDMPGIVLFILVFFLKRSRKENREDLITQTKHT